MFGLLNHRFSSSDRGQAAVETALVLSIIMLLALATLDLGRGIVAHIALTEATQEGAMYAGYELHNPAASPDVTVADVEDRVTESSSADVVADAIVTVPACAVAPGYITVRSTYDLAVLTPLASFIFGPSIPLSVEVKATNFHGACS